MIEYKSPNGFRGTLKGREMTIYNDFGTECFHTSRASGYTFKYLKEMVDEMPDLIRELVKEKCIADAEE